MFTSRSPVDGALRADHVLRAVLESPQDLVIFALDRDYRYLAFNDNHRRTMKVIWGADIEVGQRMPDIIKLPDDRARAIANFDRALAGETFTIVEAYGADRNRRYYEDAYSPIRAPRTRAPGDLDPDASDTEIIGLTLFLKDITAERARDDELAAHGERLEQLVDERTRELAEVARRLQQAEKLESLGLLAGGIAHDFNNLLAGILGYCDLALELMPPQAAAVEAIQQVRHTAMRGADLTDMMLAATGRRRRQASVLSLDSLVAELESLLRLELAPRLSLTLDLAPAPLEGDKTQLSQVLVNLVSNAVEAIGSAPGSIRVTCGARDIDKARLAKAFGGDDLLPGRYAVLEVADDGPGMDPDTLSRIFDPFFTTKFAGRGLGLAAVFGIVRGHGGAIEVESTRDAGTRFAVFFRATDRPVAAPLPPRPASHPTLTDTGTILVADDDAVVRAVAGRILRSRGFSVIEAADGPECLERLKESRAEIRTILLDLTMPRLSGEQTLLEIRAIAPNLPVVLFSGFSEYEAEKLLRGEHTYWLKKPFELAGLVAAVRHAIEAGSVPS